MCTAPLRLLLVIVVIFLGAPSNEAARILAVMPTPAYSHQSVPKPLWRELALRGHEVVLITSHPTHDPELTNLKEIDMSWMTKPENKKHNISDQVKDGSNSGIAVLTNFVKMFHNFGQMVLNYEPVKKLIADENEHFDLVMIEYLHPTMYAFQHRFKCPFIGVTSLDASTASHKVMGNPVHPYLYPETGTYFNSQASFKERINNLVVHLFVTYFHNYIILPMEDATVKEHFGQDYPPLADIAKEIDLLFMNVNPAFQHVRPHVPATISIGGGIHMQKPKPLPEDLQKYLDEAKEGVVYFSLGGSFRSADIAGGIIDTVVEVFRELPYKVLWKFEEEIPNKPDNVKILNWIPQQDVLRHKNVKMFITQGGLQSAEEGILNHKPMVAIPFNGEQEMNSKAIVNKGLGLELNYKELTKDGFKKAIIEVIENKTYLENVKKTAELMMDQPMTGLERAVWWTEYVLRNKGAKHLKGPATELPLYQYFFLDIAALVIGSLIVLGVLIILLWKLLKCTFRCVFQSKKCCLKTKKIEKKEKKN